MGFGHYDYVAHVKATAARAAEPDQLFGQRLCHPAMVPQGVVRESRDSDAHPESVGIIFALDVSGSMGEVPRQLATGTLPTFMKCVTTMLPDAQVLFLALGNAYADHSPLQVGQFESEAHLMDQWLERTHLEGGGGGLGESYDLAMLFASRCTAIDGWQKRHKKSYLFITGDEPPFSTIDGDVARRVLGIELAAPLAIHDTIREVAASFHPFFIIPDFARAKQYQTEECWGLLLRERTIVLDAPEDTAVACAVLIGITEGRLGDREAIEDTLEGLGWLDARRDRVVRSVLGYLEAFLRGPIADPAVLGSREVPGVKG